MSTAARALAVALAFVLVQRPTLEMLAPKPSTTLVDEGIRTSSVTTIGTEERSPIGHCDKRQISLESKSTFFHDGGGEKDSSKS